MRQAAERPSRAPAAPATIDIDRPSAARMYDYYLGGSHNFSVDRAAAHQVIAAVPDAPLMAQANRAFLRRVVRYLTGVGIRQFLDLGSGIPTAGNVHEIAQQAAPEARVVYVDMDPVAVAHSREILAENARATAIAADIRQPGDILEHPEVRRLLDFDQPLALMIVSVMHFVPDTADPPAIVARFRDALAPGSYLALSQATDEGRLAEERAVSHEVYRQTASPLYPRTRAEVAELFAGLELVEPGLVWITQWRPETEPPDQSPTVFVGGLGKKVA